MKLLYNLITLSLSLINLTSHAFLEPELQDFLKYESLAFMEYKDEFGDKTGVKYISTMLPFRGTFSNSYNNNSELKVHIFYDKDAVNIQLDEYGDGTYVKGGQSASFYTLKIKDSAGEIHELSGTLLPKSNRIILYKKEFNRFMELILKSNYPKCLITSPHGSIYSFTVPIDHIQHSKLIRMMKTIGWSLGPSDNKEETQSSNTVDINPTNSSVNEVGLVNQTNKDTNSKEFIIKEWQAGRISAKEASNRLNGVKSTVANKSNFLEAKKNQLLQIKAEKAPEIKLNLNFEKKARFMAAKLNLPSHEPIMEAVVAFATGENKIAPANYSGFVKLIANKDTYINILGYKPGSVVAILQVKSHGFYGMVHNHGLQLDWHPNGNLEREGNYRNGKEIGLHSSYRENGTKKTDLIYDDYGQIERRIEYDEKGQETYNGSHSGF